mgnify:CR=1 FL=1
MPIILAIFILIVNPNVIFNTLKSNTNGCDNPNSCPKASQLSQSTCAESFPIKPPITSPAQINIIKIYIYILYNKKIKKMIF